MTAPTQQARNQLQGQRSQQGRQPRSQQVQPEDFFGPLQGSLVEVRLADGQQLSGVLNKVSRFQIGLLINGEQIFVNKGFIVMIKPRQLPTGQAMQGGYDHGNRRLGV